MSSLISDVVDPSILTTVAAVTAATAVVGWMATKSKGKTNDRNGRRWSCMSESMAHGSFPPKSKFDEAIINAVLVFDDDDRPSVDEIVERCVKVLLQYERFSSVFDREYGSASCCDELDPYDLVRVVPVSDCSSDEDLLKEMEGQACVPLAQAPRGTLLPWWEFVLLENTNTNTNTNTNNSTKENGGKSAVIWRIHHSLGK